MKKNKMMRTASGLMIATLLTTGVISGTFAKYVTEDSASDTARVAKWGVTALVSGTLYGQNYSNVNDGNNEINVEAKGSVDTKHDDNIVAPGTKNSKGLNLKISGTPEVNNTVELKTNGATFKEISLNAGTYATLVKTSNITADNFNDQSPLFTVDTNGYTLAGEFAPGATYYEVHDITTVAENVDNTGKYYPILYTVEGAGKGTYRNVAGMFENIKTDFNKTYTAGQTLNTTAKITWEWAFEGQDNAADTILGNLIAEKKDATTEHYVVKYTEAAGNNKASAEKVEEGTDYCLDTNFNITLTVTQND